MEEKKIKLQGVSIMDHPRIRAVAPLVMFVLVCVLFYFLTLRCDNRITPVILNFCIIIIYRF